MLNRHYYALEDFKLKLSNGFSSLASSSINVTSGDWFYSINNLKYKLRLQATAPSTIGQSGTVAVGTTVYNILAGITNMFSNRVYIFPSTETSAPTGLETEIEDLFDTSGSGVYHDISNRWALNRITEDGKNYEIHECRRVIRHNLNSPEPVTINSLYINKRIYTVSASAGTYGWNRDDVQTGSVTNDVSFVLAKELLPEPITTYPGDMKELIWRIKIPIYY